jgi:hypothetical protein
VKQLLAVEFEKTGETCAANQERQPVAVVRPHLVVGNGIERGPERRRFIGLARLAFEIVGEKDRAMQAVTVAKLEMQFAAPRVGALAVIDERVPLDWIA